MDLVCDPCGGFVVYSSDSGSGLNPAETYVGIYTRSPACVFPQNWLRDIHRVTQTQTRGFTIASGTGRCKLPLLINSWKPVMEPLIRIIFTAGRAYFRIKPFNRLSNAR